MTIQSEPSQKTEQERIDVLRRYQILDTPPDGSFDRIAALASQLLRAPIGIVSLVDTNRIWFKAHHGLDVQEIDRDPGLCASAILENVPYVLSDALKDPRSLTNPLVSGEFGLRFYAGVPLKTHDNYNLGMLCVLDFQPRTITEEELDILQNLAQIVMDEMELRLASRQIHQLSKEKSELLAVLSHEIRTPLNGIMAIADLLHSTEPTEEQSEYVDIIQTSGKSLLVLLNHILDYSKMDAGKMELNIEPFSIHSCIEEVCQLFMAQTENKGIDLNHEIDSAIPMVLLGDEHKIRQILVNLVGNAVKFTKKGEVNTTVRLISIQDNPNQANVSFTVKDTGIGIRSDQICRLFRSFTQVHAKADGEQYEGAGLGLSICKQLVELMDGRIWIEESNEGGTAFTFEIKLPVISG
ncbi:GAF domain-containing sensor histidine kinase [Paenibacillus sp. QZ-Y1]|uniref:GAF domain-containing sensor histidine kinase n=1 Tax=Paenibacillus sp. QZ-Y1 TaxID=3414511 RepID=UPI003F7B0F55